MSAVYLLGFRGAGKTTLGEKVASELGWRFLDLDQEWEKQHALTILSFVQEWGEEAFRESEYRLLREVEAKLLADAGGPTIVALGGGVVDFAPSLELLRESAHPKIYLKVNEENLWARLSAHPARREIGGLSDIGALAALLARRRPSFEEIATYSVINQDITFATLEVKRLLSHLT